MKNIIILYVNLFVASLCMAQTKYGDPEVNALEVQKTFMNWSNYQQKHIMLSRDFIALDENTQEISKELFLTKLSSGGFIPIRLTSADALFYYKLFKIEPTSDTSIKATITQIAFDEYEHFKMEGKPFPKFSFKDLNGNLVTNETMKGKIMVIKCWYIHCAACVKEFPDVNKLAAKYKDREDILFVSLAEDTPEQLKAFLLKKPLSYAVIPNMKIYMNETLHLNAFPTHFILNKEGMMVKVLPNYESLEVALEIESMK